jgi:YVTN family beta-propeller protein
MRELICSTDTDSGTISVIERTDQGSYVLRSQIPIGNAPRGAVKFTRDGRGYVSNCGGDTISEIDVLTGREVMRVRVGVAPRGIGLVPGDRFALVSNSGSNTVSVVDLCHRTELAQVAVGRDPRHMAISKDGKHAYVAIWGSDYVSKLDIRALTDPRSTDAHAAAGKVCEVARMHVRSGAHPYSVALDPSGEQLLVANTQSPHLSVFSTANDALRAEVDLGSKGARAIAFMPDGQTAFVSVEDTAEVVAVDLASLRIVRRIDVGPGPRGIAISNDGPTLFASAFARQSPTTSAERGAAFAPNSITVVDLSAARAGALSQGPLSWTDIPVGKGPCSVSVLSPKQPGS